MSESLPYLRNTEIVVGIFHGARSRARIIHTYVAESLIFGDYAPLVKRARAVNLCVLDQRLVSFPVVNPGYTFRQRIRHYNIAVRAALGHAVGPRNAGIRHPAGMDIRVYERAHHVALPLRLNQKQEWEVRTESVPDSVEISIVRLVGIQPDVLPRKFVRHVV